MNKVAGLFVTGACGCLTAMSVSAHHSDSAFYIEDRTAEGGAVRIEGTISRARLINPHAEMWVEVVNDAGEKERWVIVMDSWNELRRYGWTQDTIQVGDKVAVVVAQSKFHPTAGRLRDFLIYDPEPGVAAQLFLEYIPDSENPLIGKGSAPERMLEHATPCPNYRQIDPGRSRGEDSILCFALTQSEFEAVKKEYAGQLVILGE